MYYSDLISSDRAGMEAAMESHQRPLSAQSLLRTTGVCGRRRSVPNGLAGRCKAVCTQSLLTHTYSSFQVCVTPGPLDVRLVV